MQKCSCAQTCCRQSQKSAWISCALFSPLRLKATSSGSVVLQPLLGKWDCAGCLYIERVGRRDWQQRADPAALHSGCFSGCPPATRLACQSGLHPNITLVYSCHGIGLQWGIYGEMGMGQCLFPSLGHQVALCPFVMWVQDMPLQPQQGLHMDSEEFMGKKSALSEMQSLLALPPGSSPCILGTALSWSSTGATCAHTTAAGCANIATCLDDKAVKGCRHPAEAVHLQGSSEGNLASHCTLLL